MTGFTQPQNIQYFGILRLYKCLQLQLVEDNSDRELKKFLQENNAAKWLCGFGLTESTPDYSVSSKVRKHIGTQTLSDIFSDLRDQLKAPGLMSEVFSFVDASSLIAKAQLRKERDKAMKEKYEKLNNEVLPKVAMTSKHALGVKAKRNTGMVIKNMPVWICKVGLLIKLLLRRQISPVPKGSNMFVPSKVLFMQIRPTVLNRLGKLPQEKDVILPRLKSII